MPEQAVSNNNERGKLSPLRKCTLTIIVQYGCSVGRSVHSSCSGMFLPLTGMSCSSDDMSSGTVKAFPLSLLAAVVVLDEAAVVVLVVVVEESSSLPVDCDVSLAWYSRCTKSSFSRASLVEMRKASNSCLSCRTVLERNSSSNSVLLLLLLLLLLV